MDDECPVMRAEMMENPFHRLPSLLLRPVLPGVSFSRLFRVRDVQGNEFFSG